jgi:Flp pilus assembly protein TadD
MRALALLSFLLWSAGLMQTLYAQSARDLKVSERVQLPDRKTRWALVVGISQYKHVPPRFQLRFAHRDAEDFARFLRSAEGGAIPPDHIKLLTESDATISNIRAALHTWLPKSAAADDIVYIFFAGHGVVDDDNEGYFVAHDSNPQNLHATGMKFAEVDDTLSRRLKAGLVVLLADACHAGTIGWTSTPMPSNAQTALEQIGARDRSFLKLLGSRPSESSFEDVRWGGGHGVFTYSILSALQGAAERDKDGVVRASELIDYVGRVVPEETGSRQNPRVAGTFEGSLPMALLARPRVPASTPVSMIVRGPAGTPIYVDDVFRGVIRPAGDLRIEQLEVGARRVAVDLPGGESFEGIVSLVHRETTVNLLNSPDHMLARLRELVRTEKVLGPGGAWEMYRTAKFPAEQQAAAEEIISAGLERQAQECVSDYVQSTSRTLKGGMLLAAIDAFRLLKTLRPFDKSLEAKEKFCRGRVEIATGDYAEAVESLHASLTADPNFACAYSALGVAYLRLNRKNDARIALERATKLTPKWAIPFFHFGEIFLSAGDAANAVPYLEKAVQLSPMSLNNRWHLSRAYRLLNRHAEFTVQVLQIQALDPSYAPVYIEIGLHAQKRGDRAAAVDAFDKYLLLAPNYADSAQVKAHAETLRRSLPRKKVKPIKSLEGNSR